MRISAGYEIRRQLIVLAALGLPLTLDAGRALYHGFYATVKSAASKLHNLHYTFLNQTKAKDYCEPDRDCEHGPEHDHERKRDFLEIIS